MSNFFHRYRPVADRWWLFDNTGSDGPRLIASGENGREDEVEDDTTWTKLLEHYLMSEPKPDIEQILADKYRIEAALRTAVREALARHKRAGNPVATWRDGKVVWLKPEEIPEISGTPP